MGRGVIPSTSGWILGLALPLATSLGITGEAVGDLPLTIERIKPSIVGIGTYMLTRNPKIQFRGTGFVVGDGLHVVTNRHVLRAFLDGERRETLVVLIGRGTNAQQRPAEPLAVDSDHDVALLKIKVGDPLPAMTIGDSGRVREGQTYAFTGFPLGTVLGLYPVTHRAIVSSITPIVIPQAESRQLDVKVLSRLRNPFEVFQLDAIAYPGNSGSPLYDPNTGLVVGIVNMVFVKETKENALHDPSGISYAIPSAYVTDLLRRSEVRR